MRRWRVAFYRFDGVRWSSKCFWTRRRASQYCALMNQPLDPDFYAVVERTWRHPYEMG